MVIPVASCILTFSWKISRKKTGRYETMAGEKKDVVTNPDMAEEELDDESYTDMFGQWARDKLKTGRTKMKQVE
jgi:hypothetical protein